MDRLLSSLSPKRKIIGALRKLCGSVLMVGTLGLLGASAPALAAPGGGNSDAAHACQQGGYLSMLGTGGETFTSAGECARFAARGGTFRTGIIIPAGQTATLSDARWTDGPCDALAFGYQIDFGANVELGRKPAGCGNPAIPGQPTVVGPFPTAVLLRVYLNDTGIFRQCGYTVYSDGVRALVVGTNPYDVSIKDSVNCSHGPDVPAHLSEPGSGNLEVLVTIS